jgi:hypothetical protein
MQNLLLMSITGKNNGVPDTLFEPSPEWIACDCSLFCYTLIKEYKMPQAQTMTLDEKLAISCKAAALSQAGDEEGASRKTPSEIISEMVRERMTASS